MEVLFHDFLILSFICWLLYNNLNMKNKSIKTKNLLQAYKNLEAFVEKKAR